MKATRIISPVLLCIMATQATAQSPGQSSGQSTGPNGAQNEVKPGVGAVLISFDGIEQLASAATRVGMLSQVLRYTLTVGPDGKPTECTIDRKFRRKYVEVALCKPLLKHHTFQPARDFDGNPMVGSYTSSIDFRMFFNADR